MCSFLCYSVVMDRLLELRQAIDGLAALETAALSDDELGELIVGLHRESARLTACATRVTAAFDGRRAWRDDGSRSLGAWLQQHCHTSRRGSRAQAARAKHVRLMPHSAAALAAGDIDDQHVGVLMGLAGSARKVIADAFPEAEATLVECAKTLDFEAFVAACRHWEIVVDPDGEEAQAADDVEARRLHLSETFRGNVVLDGQLDPISGAIVSEQLRRIERELFRSDRADAKAIWGESTRVEHLARTAAQRRADALVEMATRSATAPADGRRPKPLFVFHVGYESSARRMLELANGTVVAPGQLLPYLSEAEFERVVWGPGDRVLTLSKRARFFAGGLRQAVKHRDRRCTAPGCRVPADDCDIDHVQPWAHGGETTQDNARCRCDHHNRHLAKPSHSPPSQSPLSHSPP
jgi:hypothetical protein